MPIHQPRDIPKFNNIMFNKEKGEMCKAERKEKIWVVEDFMGKGKREIWWMPQKCERFREKITMKLAERWQGNKRSNRVKSHPEAAAIEEQETNSVIEWVKKRNEHTERKKLEETRRKKGDKQRWITWISYLSIHKFLERLHAGGIKTKNKKWYESNTGQHTT